MSKEHAEGQTLKHEEVWIFSDFLESRRRTCPACFKITVETSTYGENELNFIFYILEIESELKKPTTPIIYRPEVK